MANPRDGKGVNSGGIMGNSIAEARTELGRSGFAHGHGRRHGHGDGESGRDFRISLGTPGVKLSSL